jgi:hypothetical protein
MDSGISVESEIPGLVPEYECREAAHFVGVPWRGWLKLEGEERASAVAHYRMHLLIDAHVADASEKDADRRRAAQEARSGSGVG